MALERLEYYGMRSTLGRDQVMGQQRLAPIRRGRKGIQIPRLDIDAAQDMLAMLDAATSLSDISPFKSVGLHPLKGDRKGQWAITVNGPWRICFRFEDGDAHDVEITDYH